MITWLTESAAGKFLMTFWLSVLPIVELRLGLPYGIALGLKYPLALLAAILGNMLPVPFIILFIKAVFAWLRKHWAKMDGFIRKMEKRAEEKGEKVKKYGKWALLLFVAIPAPGTGAWTGSLIAALMNMTLKEAVPVIFLGVCIAAAIMTGITFGVIHIF